MKNLFLLLSLLLFSISISAQIETLSSVMWENLDMPPSSVNKFVESNGRLWAINGNVYYYEEDEEKWVRNSGFVHSNINEIVATDFGVGISTNVISANFGSSNSASSVSWITTDNSTDFSYLRSFDISSFQFGHNFSSGLLRKSANEIVELGWRTLSENIVLKSYKVDTGWEDYPVYLGVGLDLKGSIISQDTFILKYTTAQDSLRFAFYTDDYENPEIVAVDSIISDLTVNNLSYKHGRLIGVKEGQFFHSSDFGENWSIIDYNQILDTTNVSYRGIRIKEDFLQIRRDNRIWKIAYDNLTEPELLFETDIPFYSYSVTENFYVLKTSLGTYLRRHEEEDFVYRSTGLSKDIDDLLIADSIVYANSINSFKSINGITDWHVQEEFDIDNAQFLTSINGIYYRAEGNIIYQSNNQGDSWDIYTILSSEVSKISTDNGTYFYSDSTLLFTENGIDFITGIRPETEKIYGDETSLITFDGLTRYISNDMGQSWSISTLDSIMPGNIIYTSGGLTSIELASAAPWTDTPGNVFRSEDNGTSWEKINEINYLLKYYNGNGSSTSYKYLRGGYWYHTQDLLFLAMDEEIVVSNDGGYTYYYLPVPFSTEFIGWNDTGGNHTYTSIPFPKGSVIDKDMLAAYTSNTGIYRTSLSAINQQIEAYENFRKEISGKAYIDTNYNCIFDEEDTPLTDKVITFDEYVATTDADGNYSVELPAQSVAYEFEIENLQYHYLDCLPDNQEIEVVYGSEAEEQDFAFQPFELVMDTIVQGVCIGEEWLGNLITQDTVWADTVLTETQILLTIYEAFAVEDSETEIFLSITEPQIVGGTIVLYDTMFTKVYEDYYGCDSTVTFNVDVLSNVKEYDNQSFIAVLHPNPTSGSSVLFINSAENKVVDIDVLTIDGKLIFEAVRGKEIFAEDNYLDLDMTDLPAGVYYLSIQSKSGERQYLKFIKI